MTLYITFILFMKHYYFSALALMAVAFSYGQCPPAGLTITNQSQLDNFILTYPNCTEINGDVTIDEVNISNLNGLANIVSITGALEIREVPALANLNGLQNLETVGTDLILREVGGLNGLGALSSLTSVGGEFTVRSCPDLMNLDGVENLTTVGLGLIIRDCESLTSIEGLSGVSFVGEILEVVENPILTSLSGLESVATIVGGEEGALVIEENGLLTSLAGLGNASTVMTGDVTIASNGLLAFCAVPSICNYLQNPPVGALITINTNLLGCNSQAEVQTACAVLDTDYFTTEEIPFRILQNPIVNELKLHSTEDRGTVVVYDALGRQIHNSTLRKGINNYTFEGSAGLLIVVVESGEYKEVFKVVKQ